MFDISEQQLLIFKLEELPAMGLNDTGVHSWYQWDVVLAMLQRQKRAEIPHSVPPSRRAMPQYELLDARGVGLGWVQP